MAAPPGCLRQGMMEIGGQPKDHTWCATFAWRVKGWVHPMCLAQASVLYLGHRKGQQSVRMINWLSLCEKYPYLVIFRLQILLGLKEELTHKWFTHATVVSIHISIINQLKTHHFEESDWSSIKRQEIWIWNIAIYKMMCTNRSHLPSSFGFYLLWTMFCAL